MVTARPEDTTMTPRTHRPDVTEPAMTRSRTLLAPLCAALALLAAACSGGAERAIATAKAKLETPATCVGTGAHDRHQQLGFGCTVCHPGDGGTYGFETYAYPGGTSTAGGVILLASAGGPTTCTVACHSPLGSPAHPVTWDTPGPLDCTACHTATALPPTHPPIGVPNPGAGDCVACHDQGQHTTGAVKLKAHPPSWMVQTDPGFHAVNANKGLANCQACHGGALDGGAANVACRTCHDADLPAGVATWTKNCTMCHGDRANGTGAPPRATWGNTADLVRVGAHTAHVSGSAISPPFDCELCHVKPLDALDAFHIDQPTARVSFAGRAVKAGVTPAWDRTAATCSNVACHGSATPQWTGGPSQATCGTCHALPPASPHPALADASLTGCVTCHPNTMTAAGTIIPPAQGGTHLDGMVQSNGHDAAWMDPASARFHAVDADRGLGPCQACHGADLAGGSVGVACGQCHDQDLPAGVTTWSKNCTMCHGNQATGSPAPPRTTWGNAGDPLRVGAHAIHLAGSAIAGPVACSACHEQFADARDPNHIVNGIAHLKFGGLSTASNARPSWDRSTATCASTYCHGGYTGSYTYSTWDYALDQPVPVTMTYTGGNGSPTWTGGPMTCTSCHGNPPSQTGNWHSTHGGGTDCQLCHPDAVGSGGVGTAITNPALHVNGVVEVTPVWTPHCFYCH